MKRGLMRKQIRMYFAGTCALCLALGMVSIAVHKAAAQSEAKPAAEPTQVEKSEAAEMRVIPPAIAKSTKEQREAWRLKMVHTPRKERACYTATYPDTQWHEVPCKTPPKHYFAQRHFSGGTTDSVGAGHDYLAQPTNTIALAEGSFDPVTDATSITTQGAGAGGDNGPNQWSLQLNSNYFNTSLCNTNGLNVGSRCRGVAQFVYDNGTQQAYVQYWLATTDDNPLPGYPNSCPSGGWQAAYGYCVNTPTASQPFTTTPGATDLHDLKITGQTSGVSVYWGGNMISSPADNVIPDLASGWGTAEFNIFGNGGGGQAVFNSGVSITVRTQVDTGTNIAPDCVPGGSTLETNSLNLVSTPAIVPKAQYPSIVFDESNVSTSTASCSTSIGDPHITTFDGLYYDFYAAGDYVLADAGPDFIVHARQESGAKVFNNPNVTMNTAVAVQMGTSRIAIYDSPTRVVLNGKTIDLADNKIMTLPGGVYLYRMGSLYVVTRDTGELVRAQLNNGWMDLTVGLGHRARSSAKGIMASPTKTALSLRDGTRLNEPVSKTDLYQRYAKSWLVQPNESLFAEHAVEFAEPAKVFTSADLEPGAAAKARAACVEAGIADLNHLESCTVDAAVLKDTVAVKAFTHAIAPKITIKPVENLERK